MESGDVAVADEWLGILADHIKVQQGKQTHGSEAAAQAEDPGDVFAAKSFVEVGGTLGVCSGHVAVVLPAAGHNHRIEPQQFHRFDGGFQVDGRDRRRWCGQSHRVARLQRAGIKEFVHECVLSENIFSLYCMHSILR